MTNYYKNIFRYLEEEKIIINKSEFEFQIQSHAEYPSLLAVSDILLFFNINNKVFKIPVDNLESMPNFFLALTQKEGESEDFSFIKKENDKYFVNDQSMTKTDFTKIFKNIVLIAEKSAQFENTSTYNYQMSFVGLIIGLMALPILMSDFYHFNWLFFCLSVLGIYFSYETFNLSLGISKGFSSKFCSYTPQTNCENVVKSNKWKVFETLSLSDISLVFFSSQLMLIVLYSFINQFKLLIETSSCFMWLSLPLIFLSVYYQKNVEKKWCPLCLMISCVLLIQTVLVYIVNPFYLSSVDLKVLLTVSFVFILLSIAWYFIKNLTIKSNDYKNQLSKAIRFKRNYSLFKEQLLKTEPLHFPKNDHSVYYGNKEANIQITLLTSPFCEHCKKAHEILQKLHQKYNNKLAFHICYSIDIESESSATTVIKNLQQLFLKEGLERYEQELKSFYNKDNYINDFIEQTKNLQYNLQINELLKKQNEFTNQNQLNFTPMIFINGYKFPDIYEKEDFEFFINDLNEDNF